MKIRVNQEEQVLIPIIIDRDSIEEHGMIAGVKKSQIRKWRVGNRLVDVVLVPGTKAQYELIEGRDIPIKNIVIPKTLIVDETFQEFRSLLRKHSINLQMIEAGDYLQDGAMGITCLHPSADFRPSTVNSYSMVLSVNLGEFDLLLTGDLELSNYHLNRCNKDIIY